MLEKNLKGIVDKGESLEVELIENLIEKECIQEPSVVANSCLEKVDPNTLKWRKRPFEASESIWEEDDKFKVDEVMTPVAYFCTFLDI